MKKMTESKEFKTLIKRTFQYNWTSTTWSDWGMLFRFLIIICYLLEGKGKLTKSYKSRKLNKWVIFVGEQMKQGKTIKEAAELWKKEKIK